VVAFVIGEVDQRDIQRLYQRYKDEFCTPLQVARILTVPRLPVNAHGKVDRSQLQSDKSKGGSLKRNTDDCGIDIFTQLWTELLGSVPGKDDFFLQKGGDSFLAVSLQNSLAENLSVESASLEAELQADKPILKQEFLETLLNKSFASVCDILREPVSTKVRRLQTTKSTDRSQVENTNKIDVNWSNKKVFRLKGRENRSRPNPATAVKADNPEVKSNQYPDNGHQSVGATHAALLPGNREHRDHDWKVDFLKCIDSSPLLVCDNDVELVVVGSHSGFVKAINPRDGEQIWSTRLCDRVEGSPATDFTSIYVGCYDHHLYSINISDGSINWKFKTEGIVKCTPLIRADALFFGSYDRKFYKLDKTGGCIWSIDISEGSVYASPVEIAEGILVATLSGELVCVTESTGDLVWRMRLGRPVFANPLWDEPNQLLYVPCVDHNLYAVSASGTIEWKLTVGAPIYSSPVLYNQNILFGCHDCHVYLVNPSGVVVWKVFTDKPVFSSLDYSHNGLISCANIEGNIFILKGNGEIVSREKVPGHVFSSPIFFDAKIIVGCRDNYLYCLQGL